MVNFYQSLDNFMGNKKQQPQGRKLKSTENRPKRRNKGDLFSKLVLDLISIFPLKSLQFHGESQGFNVK